MSRGQKKRRRLVADRRPKAPAEIQADHAGLAGRQGLLIGLAIFVVGLGVRLIYLHDATDNPTFKTPLVDAAFYDETARSLVAGRPMSGDFFWQPVFYPSFLAVSYFLSGSSIVFVKVIQALIGAFTCVLVYLLGGQLFDRNGNGLLGWTGLVAAVITVLYGPLIFFEGELLATGWAAFWSVALILLFLQAGRRKTLGACFVLGLCGALSVLTRPTFLPFFLAGCVWLAVALWRVRLGPRLLAVLAGFGLVVLPVAIQNKRINQSFSFLPGSGPINLYLGNNPNACETINIRPGEQWGRLTTLAERSGFPGPQGQQQFFRQETLNYLRGKPVSFARGLASKSIQFASSRELPRNTDVYVFRQWSGLLGLLVWKVNGFGFPFGVLAPLSLVGLIFCWRRIPWPLALFVVLYPVSIVLVFVTARYRMPVVPAMIVLAAAGLLALIEMIRAGQSGRLGLAASCMIGVGLLCTLPGPFCQEEGNFESELYYLIGRASTERGQLDQAMSEYAKAIEIDPNNADAHKAMGAILIMKGHMQQAVERFSEALTIKPDSAEAHYNLGLALLSLGQTDQAIDHFRQALEVWPGFPLAHNDLGQALAAQGKYDQAIEHFDEALRIKPDLASAHHHLGLALMEQGKIPEAVAHLTKARWLKPGDAQVRYALGAALEKQLRPDEAIAEYRAALRINPSHQQASESLRAALSESGGR